MRIREHLTEIVLLAAQQESELEAFQAQAPQMAEAIERLGAHARELERQLAEQRGGCVVQIGARLGPFFPNLTAARAALAASGWVSDAERDPGDVWFKDDARAVVIELADDLNMSLSEAFPHSDPDRWQSTADAADDPPA